MVIKLAVEVILSGVFFGPSGEGECAPVSGRATSIVLLGDSGQFCNDVVSVTWQPHVRLRCACYLCYVYLTVYWRCV